MRKPSVSVVIPAYNEAQRITFCLSSLKKQTLREPYELIVIDNNSTDDTVHIAKRFTKRVYVEHAPGAGNARNAGILHAQSDLIVFVDADCIVPTDYLKKIIHIFTTHTDISGVSGPYEYADSGKLFTWIWPNGNYFTSLFSLLRRMFGVQPIIGGNLAIRRSALHDVGGFEKTIQDVTHMDDLTLAIRLHHNHLRVFFDPSLKILSYLRVEERSLLKDIFSRTYRLFRRLTYYAVFHKIKN